ncbi:hypothetical protein JYQ62_01855 [Nostoc sp. UHCC 0702]|nr:hypothetical protein JYQ62_01855 [Nostoc sp. UHCC 0702]
MAHKRTLNKKRLTRKQVQELIESEGKLHEEFTKFFEVTYSTGYKDQPLVYELPNDRFLFVFDPNDLSTPGKGDIYTKEYFLKLVQRTQRVREDCANNRGNSVSYWYYYSKYKVELINHIDELIHELREQLQINHQQLNFSYVSLDILSKKVEAYGINEIQSHLYDNLVAYVGEILRQRKNGYWAINNDSMTEKYPYISAGVDGVMMPINVVWLEITDIESIDLRKQTANEVRRFSLRQI